MPLIVKDPRGVLTRAPERVRTQLTSSVDVAPLLLTIATGSDDWRREPHYAHLAGRLDLAAILADPQAPGRAVRAARHRRDRDRVRDRALRGRRAAARRRAAHARGQVRDLLQLAGARHRPAVTGSRNASSTTTARTAGRLELHNSAGHSPLEQSLRASLERAFHDELRGPLPHACGAAHARGFADYFSTATRAADARGRRRSQTRQLTNATVGQLQASAARALGAVDAPRRR